MSEMQIIDSVIEIFESTLGCAVDGDDYIDELDILPEDLDVISDAINDAFETSLDIEADELETVSDVVRYILECMGTHDS